MEKYIIGGKISDIKTGTTNDAKTFVTFKVSYKNIWVDKQTNTYKGQVISKSCITSNTFLVNKFLQNIIVEGSYVVVEGTPKAETFVNANNETKALLKMENISNIEVLSQIDLAI